MATVALAASLLLAPAATAEPTVPRPSPKDSVVLGLKTATPGTGPAIRLRSGARTGQTIGNISAIKGALAQLEVAAPVLIVHTDSAAAVSTVARAAGGDHLVVRQRFAALKTLSVQVPAGQLTSTIASLQNTAGVTSVQIGIPRQLLGVPNDPDLPDHQNKYLTAVAAPTAWTTHHSSASVLIAVVDSGVDITHPDLAGKIVGRFNAVDGSTDVTDAVGHGTFVAGVAAAVTDNGIGIAGAGYDASLLAVKVADKDGTLYDDNIANGIVWAADNGARVINLSFGSATPSSVEQDAINYAVGKGALVVAAAGNSGGDGNPTYYPAAYPNVLAVGATDGTARAAFSEHGSWVDVAAPGVNIFSTTPLAGSSYFGPGYATGDGTSFSSPLVAGEAALVLEADPTAPVADLRTAITGSAHGFAGLGLGAGQVDFRAAFDHLRPGGAPQITAPSDGGSVSGVATLAARSDAPTVRFQIDGVQSGPPVASRSGSATSSWSTWGLPNGRHTIGAQQCSVSGVECSAGIASVTVSVSNRAPATTSPRSTATVSGSFTMTATSDGGGLAFYVDGVRRGFDASAPYSMTYSGSALKDGPHRVHVVQCAVNGTACAGPSSADINFNSRSLHPNIVAVTPDPFSPNGDTRQETATATFDLAETQGATIAILDARGVTVRGPVTLGSLRAGRHTWVWNGRDNGGRRPADGSYTAQISTSWASAGVILRGATSHSVRIDTAAPAMTRVTGSNATFFPKVDGYQDTFTPTVVLAETAWLTLTIRNTKGPVRTITAIKRTGLQSLAWNGRNQANVLVPAGRYTWTLTASDAAGNTRSTAAMPVTVSLKALVGKTVTLVKSGIAASASGASDDSCAEVDTAHSDFYPQGRWLLDICDDPSEIAAAFYIFALPAAIQYRTIQLSAFGNTYYGPTRMRGTVQNPTTGQFDITAGVQLSSHANAWYDLGTVTGATHVAGRSVTTGVFVTTETGYYSDFDIGQVRLVVTYTVLQ